MSLWADLAWIDLWLTKVTEKTQKGFVCFFVTPLFFVLLGEETGTVGGV